MSVTADFGHSGTCLAFGDNNVIARRRNGPGATTGPGECQNNGSRKRETEVGLHLGHPGNHPANCGSEACGIGIGKSAFDGPLGGEKVDAQVAIVVERVSIGQLIHGVRTQVGQLNDG